MSKKACKDKDFEDRDKAKYECGKCGAKARKEEKVCKPHKIK